MTLLKVKIHADGIESYCFFWFFLFLDFENFNDQTAQAGTKIVVPYRQNNTQHIKKTVCVCVCVENADFNVKSRCCIQLPLSNHILYTKCLYLLLMVTAVGSHLLCNVSQTKCRPSVNQPPYCLPQT